MKKHALWMLIGCVLPILLIFLLPVMGIKGNGALILIIILILACHLIMVVGHKKKFLRK
jgi:cell division protein FtsW (lipid II flippase)